MESQPDRIVPRPSTDPKECSVCMERAKSLVMCPFCKPDEVRPACVGCTKKYLLGLIENAHCMGCRTEWSAKTIVDLLGKTFYNTMYRKRRQEVSLEHEKNLVPETMDIIAVDRKIETCGKDIEEIDEQLSNLTRLKRAIRTRSRQYQQAKRALMLGDPMPEIDETEGNLELLQRRAKAEFPVKCDTESCLGYVDLTDGKCGICQRMTCVKCGRTKPDDPHECRQSDVESLNEIRKTTKICPECKTPITRISGCDQMWCTGCNTAFNWQTGEKINGPIHNPHYHDAVRRGMIAIQAVRNPECANLDQLQNSLLRLTRSFPDADESATPPVQVIAKVTEHLRRAIELQDELDGPHGLRAFVGDRYTRFQRNKLRLQYIRKEIDDPVYKRELFKLQRKHDKYEVYVGIVSIYVETCSERFRQLVADLVTMAGPIEAPRPATVRGRGRGRGRIQPVPRPPTQPDPSLKIDKLAEVAAKCEPIVTELNRLGNYCTETLKQEYALRGMAMKNTTTAPDYPPVMRSVVIDHDAVGGTRFLPEPARIETVEVHLPYPFMGFRVGVAGTDEEEIIL